MSSIWFLQATQFWLCVPALCIALVRAQFSVWFALIWYVVQEEQVDRSKHWGDLEEEEEDEEEDEEEEEVEPNEEDLEDGMTSVDTLSTYVFKALFLLGCFTEMSWTLWPLLCCSQNWVAHATTIVFEDILWLQAASISLNRTPTGVETPDVIDLRKTQRKEPEKPLYHVSLALLHRHLTWLVDQKQENSRCSHFVCIFRVVVYWYHRSLMSDAGFGGEGGTHSARDHYGCKSHVTFLLIWPSCARSQ